MSKLKKLLAGKVLLILLATAGIVYIDKTSDLKLGLDLKGGTQLDYSIDLSKVAEADREQIIEGVQEVIRKRVDGLGVSEPNIYLSSIADEFHVIVELAGITNIEEAKDTVGKTIQLEFKELSLEPSDENVEIARQNAQAFYDEFLAGGDFVELAEKAEAESEVPVTWSEAEPTELSSLFVDTKDALEGKAIGSIIGPFEAIEGFLITGTGTEPIENKNMVVIELKDKYTEEKETVRDEEVSARHILITYEGAEKSNLDRTKEEAETLANELLERVRAGEKIEDLAGEFSDDVGSGLKGGDLESFGRGVMTANFEDTAFGMEIGSVSEIVETEFGFHIIEVYDKQEGETTTENVEMVSYNRISFSTQPDPWKEEPALTGEHFKHADVAFSQSYEPYVSITFTDEGGDLFEELTERSIGNPIAIFVGGQLISAPTVQSVIAGGQGQITGAFSLEEAQELARDLNTGAIPAPIELIGQFTISATLGAEALDQSIYAGIVGLIILAFFMLAYYRLPGLIANIALGIYAALLIFFIKISLPTAWSLLAGLAVFSYLVHIIAKNDDSGGEKFISFLLACVVLFFLTFVLSSQVTMTLAGIAGVILSIGMAVDANVLIFERMKEELVEGKSMRDSIDDGFRRAWDSIRDSNFSSLITCAILFSFGSSIIRGFALNLALGILVSMFSAIMLTRTMLHFAESINLKNEAWLFGKPKKKRGEGLQIIANTKIWAGLSGFLLTTAIVATLAFRLNLGIDFTGGTLMEVKLGSEEVTSENLTNDILSVEEALVADLGMPQIVSTDQGSFIIRLKHLGETEHDALLAKFTENYESAEEIRFTTVGPSIGATLKKKAINALAVTLFMIVIYIAFAFRKIPKEVSQWRFGFCAIAALVHDILIVLGVFVLMGHFMDVEIDALFITALLTIMGFSVHDTIVVFDRVRENLMYRGSEDTLAVSANRALNQTMARSINTSISTLITVVALLIFGAESIKMFVLALTIGIVAGTYSSIFVASPLLVWWNDRVTKRSI